MSQIRVVVSGIHGKMGREAAFAVMGADDLQLVGGIDPFKPSEVVSELRDVPVFEDASDCFTTVKPDVLIDFTHAKAALTTVDAAVSAGVRPVIGTTGLPADFLADIDRRLKDASIGGLHAPNFAIGALLMMRVSELIVRHMPDVEIIEYHHETKKDAPSGTAKKTAQKLAKVRADVAATAVLGNPDTDRVGLHRTDGIPIHSVRLPGFIAHQEVIFGGFGERLTIRHDSMSRTSFMPGVLLGVRSVMAATGLVDGLEHFLF